MISVSDHIFRQSKTSTSLSMIIREPNISSITQNKVSVVWCRDTVWCETYRINTLNMNRLCRENTQFRKGCVENTYKQCTACGCQNSRNSTYLQQQNYTNNSPVTPWDTLINFPGFINRIHQNDQRDNVFNRIHPNYSRDRVFNKTHQNHERQQVPRLHVHRMFLKRCRVVSSLD